ncbi:ras suppressor protein 1 isoform X1 [Grammomys surdaster]|uniref:ras suppressor protein 1 isoform X1 n=1 Tax=Grammomys surdaster TaxID=491861 RepID=UPI00109F3D50|nr:ras suppressor protein 1 isoform X1 [Grammomys surdaster]
MSKSLKKLVEESREKNQPEVDMSDRGISSMLDVNGLFSLAHITQLVLSHNKLTTVPPNVAELKNLEVLNFFNNQIEELPTQISSLQKLKHLNLGMNRLNTLPRGFGSLPALEVLDLTYNNLNEHSLPGNFFYLTTLRALYLSDNDFEILPPDIGKLTKLQILSLRDNDLISLPKEIGELTQLKELHIQGNRLTVLPPELASTADTCKQTQNPQRRITTNQKRSAGNPLQPRTNEEETHTHWFLASFLYSSGPLCSVLQINTVCWCLLFFLKENPFLFPLPVLEHSLTFAPLKLLW